MPAALVKFPVECLRGWTQLAEKQQRRVRALFAAGEGATMRKVTEEMQREKAAIAAAKEVKLTTTSSDLVTKNHSQLSSTLAKTAGDENINDANERQHIRF
jgi:SAM-dependent MidA family methyltransferase